MQDGGFLVFEGGMALISLALFFLARQARRRHDALCGSNFQTGLTDLDLACLSEARERPWFLVLMNTWPALDSTLQNTYTYDFYERVSDRIEPIKNDLRYKGLVYQKPCPVLRVSIAVTVIFWCGMVVGQTYFLRNGEYMEAVLSICLIFIGSGSLSSIKDDDVTEMGRRSLRAAIAEFESQAVNEYPEDAWLHRRIALYGLDGLGRAQLGCEPDIIEKATHKLYWTNSA
jgi:hypothetical protein